MDLALALERGLNLQIQFQGSNQPLTKASSRYPSYQRRLGTECEASSANFPDKLDRWRHIRNRRGQLGTRLGSNLFATVPSNVGLTSFCAYIEFGELKAAITKYFKFTDILGPKKIAQLDVQNKPITLETAMVGAILWSWNLHVTSENFQWLFLYVIELFFFL